MGMNWLQKIAQNEEEEARLYFSIGHGDYNEKEGFEPKYFVWAYIRGSIEIGPEGYGDADDNIEHLHGGTHGSLWGHDMTDKTYKGRYEPETGTLSIVKPKEKEYYPIPSVVMQALWHKFKNITQVVEF